MNRFLYRSYLLAGGVGHWLRRRLTPAGWLVFLGLIVAAGLGADPERSIAYQSFAILFCLLALAICHAPFFRVRLAVRRDLPRFGTVGTPLAYSITLRNSANQREAGLVLLENLANAPITFEEFIDAQYTEKSSFKLSQTRPRLRPAALNETPLPVIPPHAEIEVKTDLLPLKRGALRFSGVTLARPDTLGLFRAFHPVQAVQSVLILPKRYALPPIPLPGTRRYQLGGVALAMSVGESEEFVALRDYRRGDPLRHIHWKSWAKTGKPIVREFEDEYFVRHALILDTFAPADGWQCFEEAVSIAASFACTINTQESLLDLMFIGPEAFCFTAGRGIAHSDQMLEILAAVQPCRDKQFEDLERMVLEHSSLVSGCICVFLSWDASRERLVKRLKSMGVPLLTFVVAQPGTARELLKNGIPQSEGLHILELGKIQEGLQKL